jgi:PAS domain S-box-containing protein
MERFNVAIVGGGPGGLAIMDMIPTGLLRQLQMKLIAVADVDPEAPGIKHAQALGILTTSDYHDLFPLKDLNLILELTGSEEISASIQKEKPAHVRFMDHTVARLFWDIMRLEVDLDKSQKKYWKLFQDARDGIVFFNNQGQILESNYSLSHLLGYSRDEFEHMKVSELAKNTSKKILEDHLEELGMMGFVSVELEFSKKSGDPLPVEAGISWLSEEDMFQAMVRDISMRKSLDESHKLYSERLEKEVEKRTQQLRASQQETLREKKSAEGTIYGSPIPMFVLDRRHKITYWNKACEKLTGYSSEEMIGTDQQWKPFYAHKMPILADLIIESDFETLNRVYGDMNLRKSSMVEGAFEAEHYFPHLGESGTHLYFNAAPIKDDLGAIQGAIVTYQDFSERVRMTQEIRKREAFARNLIENSIDGIIATDAEGKIVIFNQGIADVLGYLPDEVIGQMRYPQILSREMTKNIRDAFYSDHDGPEGKIINMEVEVLNKEGTPIPVRISGTLLYEMKQEVGSVVFMQDLTAIQRLQKEKAQAERMAAIGQTVAGLAHYIKNILNGLKGGAYVINSAMKKNKIEMVRDGCVMDMLVYSKDRKPEHQLMDPNEVVMDVVELMKERAETAGVSIVQELMSGLKEVSMERTGIHRCLLNLVSNAIDACTLEGIVEGKGAVTIKTDSPEGWGVKFEVIDNGIGMDEETQKKVFTGFFSTKGYKGTGLGLPVTQKIVNEHDGDLSFKSHAGEGTTFTLLLPEK